jgi:hypothetical protein
MKAWSVSSNIGLLLGLWVSRSATLPTGTTISSQVRLQD